MTSRSIPGHRQALPCSCPSPFGPAGTLLALGGHLRLQVPGCSCREAVGQAGSPPCGTGTAGQGLGEQSLLQGTESSGSEASRVEIKRCFWELA